MLEEVYLPASHTGRRGIRYPGGVYNRRLLLEPEGGRGGGGRGRGYYIHTVTRPYAGFCHPDRMAPDQTVRGGENDYPILSGNLLP
jgi:hypothetical protein